MIQIDKSELQKWINDKADSMLTNLTVSQFVKNLNEAIKVNNTDFIKVLMNPNEFVTLKNKQREQLIFYYAATSFISTGKGDFLHYLIFDYKISEENSINNPSEAVDDSVIKMFEARKLKEQLNIELNHKNNKPLQYPKL